MGAVEGVAVDAAVAGTVHGGCSGMVSTTQALPVIAGN